MGRDEPQGHLRQQQRGHEFTGLGAGNQEFSHAADADYDYFITMVKVEAAAYLFSETKDASYQAFFDAERQKVPPLHLQRLRDPVRNGHRRCPARFTRRALTRQPGRYGHQDRIQGGHGTSALIPARRSKTPTRTSPSSATTPGGATRRSRTKGGCFTTRSHLGSIPPRSHAARQPSATCTTCTE